MHQNFNVSPKLSLPFILPSQAQKHITHNEAVKDLDTLVQLVVLSRSINEPPVETQLGQSYIVPTIPSSNWGHAAGTIVTWSDGVWVTHVPLTGWRAWVADEGLLLVYHQNAWQAITAEINTLDQFGINTTADEVNRLAVSSKTTLLTHEGAGHQLKINKNLNSDTASVLFQTNYVGHAEFGLAGNNDWHVKTSPDGQIWHDALIATADTGAVSFPNGVVHEATQKPLSGIMPVEGGDGQVSIYRNDFPRRPHPRTYQIDNISGDIITLTEAKAAEVYSDLMEGVSLLQISYSGSPTPSVAWVKARINENQIQVLDSDSIAAWQVGSDFTVGAVSDNGQAVIILDISPMLQNRLGAVFRQSGVILKVGTQGLSDGQSKLFVGSSAQAGARAPLFSGLQGDFRVGEITSPCTEKSPVSNSNLLPVSNSNLLYVTEKSAGDVLLGITLLSVKFVIT